MKKVFVSGCFDILHAGHIEFFQQAKGLGDYLIVAFASDELLMKYKGRQSAIPENHKKIVLESIVCIDEVIIQNEMDLKNYIWIYQPNILAVTEDEKNGERKKEICKLLGVEYVVLPKLCKISPISTTEIRQKVNVPFSVPLRVDFAGGWLDVPKFSIEGGYIVNCAITPEMTLIDCPYEKGSGVGGSAAFAILQGKDSVKSELDNGVGWQDPAIIKEKGLCVWRSGKQPILDFKANPDWLIGKMALYWTDIRHSTKDLVNVPRDYEAIRTASSVAKRAVLEKSLDLLVAAVNLTQNVYLDEGMDELPCYSERAHKYCGSGYGGYALYLFNGDIEREEFLKLPNTMKIEPTL